MNRSHENQSTDKSTTAAVEASDKQHSSEESEGGFLSRWSRRKSDVNAEVHTTADTELLSPVSADSPSDLDCPADGAVTPEAIDQPVLTDAEMPDIETLDGNSDFSPFFSEGVSKELRNKALKKLFFSGKFNARDGLDDYDDDFTNFEPLGDTVTSDMKYHARRKEKARIAALEEEQRLAEIAQQSEDNQSLDESAKSEPQESVESEHVKPESVETVEGTSPGLSATPGLSVRDEHVQSETECQSDSEVAITATEKSSKNA